MSKKNGEHRSSSLAFVAGATGPTGREVVRLLAEQDIETVAHIRPDQIDLDNWVDYFRGLGVTVDLTSWEQPEMSATLDRIKPTHVYCMLGSSRQRTRRRSGFKPNPYIDSYMAVDYGLTAMLIRAASSCGSKPRFIMVSALKAHENAKKPFQRAKGKIEEFLKSSHLPWTIIRSPVIRSSVSERMDDNTIVPLGVSLLDLWYTMLNLFGARRLRNRQHSITSNHLADIVMRSGFNPATEEMVFDLSDVREDG